MKEIITAIKNFFKHRFNLDEDKADERQIVEIIKRDVQFKGTNLWTLIFAIFIASIGLNVNSTAVIIGAMLISPLMGPIMGIGLGIGINDFDLLKQGIKNLLVAASISVIASSLYFIITPLHVAKSELLARTTPTIWDVFIAFFGGLAGIVAGTRREKSNVIPGVAIATALMPPLCTAGFGLATGQWFYFLGAFYLFFINCLFICLATFLIVRYLKFHKKEFATLSQQKRVIRSIWFIVILTILPSIYLAWRIVQRTIFEENAKSFVQNEFSFPQTQVVDRNFKFQPKASSIELLLIGQRLPENKIDSLRKRMHIYNLDRTNLVIRQGLDAKQEIDLAQIKASVLEDVFSNRKLGDTTSSFSNKLEMPLPDLKTEIKSLYPDMKDFSLSQSVVQRLDTVHFDTVTLFVGNFDRYFSARERTRLRTWLKERVKTDSIKLIIE
ncbi:TIGR00341 family protein [Chitinophagaceae bacterium LB-8]|uniref:TIGR00341 family protein n=1 Tax=Paraflavisolibacter caeni TaxID=2982496 RepID=A0A9X2XVF4_9BACT|nr:TIGR00341 family protein [Paraflavisolibacter caeni]MCU7549282.1 TIGR00341 family protein [Paraflavisolibacter caeni]